MSSRPDSAVTRWRRFLAKAITPRPDPGEAWCVHCSLNGGRTVILSAAGFQVHVDEHRRETEDGGALEDTIEITVSWPPG